MHNIVGNFGEVLNLANRRIFRNSPNLYQSISSNTYMYNMYVIEDIDVHVGEIFPIVKATCNSPNLMFAKFLPLYGTCACCS